MKCSWPHQGPGHFLHRFGQLLQKSNGLYRKLVNRQIQGDLSTVFAEIVKEEEEGEAGQQSATAAKADDVADAAPQ